MARARRISTTAVRVGTQSPRSRGGIGGVRTHRNTYVQLDCGDAQSHVYVPPPVGTVVYCVRHECYAMVTGHAVEIVVTCQTCTYTSRHGLNLDRRGGAKEAADKHARDAKHSTYVTGEGGRVYRADPTPGLF